MLQIEKQNSLSPTEKKKAAAPILQHYVIALEYEDHVSPFVTINT